MNIVETTEGFYSEDPNDDTDIIAPHLRPCVSMPFAKSMGTCCELFDTPQNWQPHVQRDRAA